MGHQELSTVHRPPDSTSQTVHRSAGQWLDGKECLCGQLTSDSIPRDALHFVGSHIPPTSRHVQQQTGCLAAEFTNTTDTTASQPSWHVQVKGENRQCSFRPPIYLDWKDHLNRNPHQASSIPSLPGCVRTHPAKPETACPVRRAVASLHGSLPQEKKVFFNNVLMVTSSPSPHIPPCCLHTRVASPKGREIGVGMARETGVMCCVLMS